MARKQWSALALAVVAMALPGSGGAAWGANWLGGSGNWTDGTMWDTGSAPTSGTASIDNGNAASSVVTVTSPVGSFSGNPMAVVIDAGDTLQLQNGSVGATSYTVNGSLQTSGTSAGLGTGQGAVALLGTGTLTFGATTTTFSIAPGILNGEMLSIGSGLTLSGPFTAIPSSTRGQWVTTAAHVMVDGAGKTVTIGGTDQILGTTPNQNTATIEATNGANLALYRMRNAAGATISISGGGTLTWGPLKNEAYNLGTINVDHSTLNFSPFSDGRVLDGTVNLNAGTITASAVDWSLAGGALLQGTGTIQSNAVGSFGVPKMGGTVSPGGAAGTGTITFTGQCVFAAGGHYACDLGAGGASDRLAAGASIDLSSTDDYLDLSQLPGVTPNVPYLIATYLAPPDGALSGVFDHVTPGYTVDYSVPGSIYVTMLPEPSAAVGLGAVAVAVAGMMRRRRGSR